MDAELKNVATKSYAITLLPSLSSEVKHYIIGDAKWYAEKVRPYLSIEEYEEWLAYFNPLSENYILDLDEFYYCMLEIMVIGEV